MFRQWTLKHSYCSVHMQNSKAQKTFCGSSVNSSTIQSQQPLWDVETGHCPPHPFIPLCCLVNTPAEEPVRRQRKLKILIWCHSQLVRKEQGNISHIYGRKINSISFFILFILFYFTFENEWEVFPLIQSRLRSKMWRLWNRKNFKLLTNELNEYIRAKRIDYNLLFHLFTLFALILPEQSHIYRAKVTRSACGNKHKRFCASDKNSTSKHKFLRPHEIKMSFLAFSPLVHHYMLLHS